MSRISHVPAPVKAVFNSFPLKTYSAIAAEDDAITSEISERKYPFMGVTQDNINNTFALGVYNVFQEPHTKTLLATDPWCLYAQFSLCKKNHLGLPHSNQKEDKIPNEEFRHYVDILSPFAAPQESLPVLIEGYNKRYIRSTEGMNEILISRVIDDPEQFIYINMLDHVVYDCWIVQLMFYLTDQQFLQLYAFKSPCCIKDLKLSLVKRNQFHLRHKALLKNLESPLQCYQKNNLNHIIKPIEDNCKTALLQFQDFMGNMPFISTEDSSPTYLELKMASYMLCIANLPEEIPLNSFVKENCQQLLHHAELALQKMNSASVK